MRCDRAFITFSLFLIENFFFLSFCNWSLHLPKTSIGLSIMSNGKIWKFDTGKFSICSTVVLQAKVLHRFHMCAWHRRCESAINRRINYYKTLDPLAGNSFIRRSFLYKINENRLSSIHLLRACRATFYYFILLYRLASGVKKQNKTEAQYQINA